MQDLTDFLKDHSNMKINNRKLFPTSDINPEITNIDEIIRQIEKSEKSISTLPCYEVGYIKDNTTWEI